MSAPAQPNVVVHVNFSSSEDRTPVVTTASEPLAGQVAPVIPVASAHDPHAVRSGFAGWWQAYVRDHYDSIGQVQWVFRVSERCARKWWNGETGCNGAQLAVAYRRHPDVVGPLMMELVAC